MKYMIEGNKEHCKGVTLHKVDNYHYILTISTKDKYYDDYAVEDYDVMVGRVFIDKKLSPTLSIRFENYVEEDDYYKEIFKVILYDECLNGFVIQTITPLKHKYQVYIVNYDWYKRN